MLNPSMKVEEEQMVQYSTKEEFDSSLKNHHFPPLLHSPSVVASFFNACSPPSDPIQERRYNTNQPNPEEFKHNK